MKVSFSILLSLLYITLSAQVDTIDLSVMQAADTIQYKHQEYDDLETTNVDIRGQRYTALIQDGDTIILADLEAFSVTSKRSFDDDAEYRKYLKFKRYANKVYPYAREAIRIFRELEYAKANMSKRDYKKEVKRLDKKLKAEFEEPLSKLTKLQGKIMIKMIERELDTTMYDLLRSIKGRFTAFYWHSFSKLYSYDLKEGYEFGKYEILDIVLQDFDVSFEIDKRKDLKYIQKKFDDSKNPSKK